MPQSRPPSVSSATAIRARPPVAAMPGACSPPAQIAASTTPAVPWISSVTGAVDPGSTSSVVGHPTGVISAACSLPGASSFSAVASPARPSYSEGSVLAGSPARSRATIASARACSTPVSARYWPTSASTGAKPPIPAYTESRSAAGPAGCPSPATTSGSQGPCSSRTWPSTQDQAASPSSRYTSPVIAPGYGAARPGTPAGPSGLGGISDHEFPVGHDSRRRVTGDVANGDVGQCGGPQGVEVAERRPGLDRCHQHGVLELADLRERGQPQTGAGPQQGVDRARGVEVHRRRRRGVGPRIGWLVVVAVAEEHRLGARHGPATLVRQGPAGGQRVGGGVVAADDERLPGGHGGPGLQLALGGARRV